jgi:hypothetical protein
MLNVNRCFSGIITANLLGFSSLCGKSGVVLFSLCLFEKSWCRWKRMCSMVICCGINKTENNKFRIVRTFLKYNTKIVEISKIDIPDTHRHDRSFSWLCTCTSLTSGGVKLFYLAKSPFLVKWNRHASVFLIKIRRHS